MAAWYRWCIVVPLACLTVVGASTGCNRRPKDERVTQKTPQLAPAAPDAKNFSAYQPAKPFLAEGGLLARKVFEAGALPGYGVEVRDWKISPGKQTESATLRGAAFVEVLSGGGSLAMGDQKQELKPGMIVSISQGQAFAVTNSGQAPLDLRIYLMTAR